MKGENTVREIQIKNLRSLKDTRTQKILPITVLVGENSSGKSTFLRSFPLLKQSIAKRTSGPILWAGDIDDYVDFGSFDESVTNDSSDEITFRFKFDVTNIGWYNRVISGERFFANNLDDPPFDRVDYQINIKSSNNRDFISSFSIAINFTKFHVDYVNQSISIDDNFHYKFKKYTTDAAIRSGRRIQSQFFMPHSNAFGFTLPDISDLWAELVNKLMEGLDQEQAHRFNLLEMVVDFGDYFSRGKKLVKLDKKKNKGYHNAFVEIYNKNVDLLNDEVNSRLRAIVSLCYMYGVYSEIDSYIANYYKNVHYIAPLRATAERYYRLRNLAVDEVDYQGKNLAVFINSLSGNRLRAFQQWTNETFGFSVKTDISKGHLSLQITLKDSDKAINLSDTGFGYSQVLPIITQLWELSSRKHNTHDMHFRSEGACPLVIAIEQPELHLHPAIQAKLAKAFIACIELAKKNNNQLQLLIETHSETIINYFGRAIASESLHKDDISIVIFEKNDGAGVTTVCNSGYDGNGFLVNWPYGFFAVEE